MTKAFDISFMGHSGEFWKGDNFEIGLPINATEPEGWRLAAYEDALKHAPSLGYRQKLLADNAHWVQTRKETIKHPDHYGGKDYPYETIKVIEAWGLGFNLGNAIKYISRAGKKGDRLEDLRKARWYLDREIEKAE